MNLLEIFDAMEKCGDNICDDCPLNQDEDNCIPYLSKLLRQETNKILAANEELKEENEELKQENIELDEKLHESPLSTFYFSPIKAMEGAILEWSKSTP